jgi:hypothetical protein
MRFEEGGRVDMAIIDLQRRQRELGRLRMGTKGPKGNPVKLDTWRLTSPDKTLLEAAAEQWGGTIKPWETEHELITTVSTLPVMIPIQDVERQQWLELWSEGGLQRRCDGQDCVLPTGELVHCLCEGLEERECKPTTTLRFYLHTLPALGVWVLRSTGWGAAAEIAGDVAMLAGKNIVVELGMDKREVKRPGKPMHRFTVPILRTSVSLESLLGVQAAFTPAALPNRPVPSLPAPPEDVPARAGQRVEVEGKVEFFTASPATPTQPDAAIEAELIAEATTAVEDPERPFDDDLFTGSHPVTLAEWLEQGPPGSLTKIQAVEQIDALFAALYSQGIWKENALAAALAKRGKTTLDDLKTRPEAVKFLDDAWQAAKKAVAVKPAAQTKAPWA